jgi:hypothetical protein
MMAPPLTLWLVVSRATPTSPAVLIRWVWLMFPAMLPGVAVMFLVNLRKARAARAQPPRAPNLLRLWLPLLSPLGYLGAMFALHRGGSTLVALIDAAPMTALFAGFALIPWGIRRVGLTPRCAKCGYERSPHALEDTESHPRCPECGADWHAKGGIAIGERRLRPWVLVLAGLLVVCPFVMLFLQLSHVIPARMPSTALPTPALIAEVSGAPRGFTMDEWAALSKRTLTPEQERTLAEGVLNLRLRRGFAATEAEAWLSKAAASGVLPAELRDRSYRELVDLWIDAPARARVGQPVSIGLGNTERGAYSLPRGAPHPYVLFGGFEVPGHAGTAPDPQPSPAESTGRRSRHLGTTTPTGHDGPQTAFTPTAPGPQEVYADLWLVILPPGALALPGQTIRWTATGEPILPPGTLWSEHRRVEATIQIDP